MRNNDEEDTHRREAGAEGSSPSRHLLSQTVRPRDLQTPLQNLLNSPVRPFIGQILGRGQTIVVEVSGEVSEGRGLIERLGLDLERCFDVGRKRVRVGAEVETE